MITGTAVSRRLISADGILCVPGGGSDVLQSVGEPFGWIFRSRRRRTSSAHESCVESEKESKEDMAVRRESSVWKGCVMGGEEEDAIEKDEWEGRGRDDIRGRGWVEIGDTEAEAAGGIGSD